MAVQVAVSIDPSRFIRTTKRLSPKTHPDFFTRYERDIAFRVKKRATKVEIIRGGRGAPHATKLTSRTGTGRRSIEVSLANVPRYSSVGSPLGYMADHEVGGTIKVPASVVKGHQRTVVFGRTVSPFNVPRHQRRAHTKKLPARKWLEPAVEHVQKQAAEIAVKAWSQQL